VVAPLPAGLIGSSRYANVGPIPKKSGVPAFDFSNFNMAAVNDQDFSRDQSFSSGSTPEAEIEGELPPTNPANPQKRKGGRKPVRRRHMTTIK
jgi:hypothetical protein